MTYYFYETGRVKQDELQYLMHQRYGKTLIVVDWNKNFLLAFRVPQFEFEHAEFVQYLLDVHNLKFVCKISQAYVKADGTHYKYIRYTVTENNLK